MPLAFYFLFVLCLEFTLIIRVFKLRGHLLIKVSNYTVIFSKFCNSTLCFVEALFLIASGRPWPFLSFFDWVSRSQNMWPWNSSWSKNCLLSSVGGRCFVYTRFKLYQALPWSEGFWVARGPDPGSWERRMEFGGCLSVFALPWSKVTYLQLKVLVRA